MRCTGDRARWSGPCLALRGEDEPRVRRIAERVAQPAPGRRAGPLDQSNHFMTKKRVHEIAKEQGLSSKELLAKLKAAGVEAKVAASSVEESVALKVLGTGAAASNGAPATSQA